MDQEWSRIATIGIFKVQSDQGTSLYTCVFMPLEIQGGNDKGHRCCHRAVKEFAWV